MRTITGTVKDGSRGTVGKISLELPDDHPNPLLAAKLDVYEKSRHGHWAHNSGVAHSVTVKVGKTYHTVKV